MKHNFETIFKKAKEMKLDTESRASMKQSLEIYMRQNPLPPSTFSHSLKTYYYRYSLTSLALAIVLIFGGTALASRDSLPGDFLYPVKIANEKVESAFAIGSKATALVQVDQAKARLQEAEELSVSVPLSTENQATLQNDFNLHVEAVTKSISTLKESGDYKDADDVEATLKTILTKHQRGFLTITASSTVNATSTATTSIRIDKHRKPIVSASSSSSTLPVSISATTTAPIINASSSSVTGAAQNSMTIHLDESHSNSGTSNSGTPVITIPHLPSI